jgi:hypothetical protein
MKLFSHNSSECFIYSFNCLYHFIRPQTMSMMVVANNIPTKALAFPLSPWGSGSLRPGVSESTDDGPPPGRPTSSRSFSLPAVSR